MTAEGRVNDRVSRRRDKKIKEENVSNLVIVKVRSCDYLFDCLYSTCRLP